nr:hypothetical protein L203_01435 [Cryptococcus depauperatus CBS 7841]
MPNMPRRGVKLSTGQVDCALSLFWDYGPRSRGMYKHLEKKRKRKKRRKCMPTMRLLLSDKEWDIVGLRLAKSNSDYIVETLLGRMLSSKTFRVVSTSLILPCLAHTVGFLVLQIHQRVTGRAYDIMQIPGTMKPFRCDPFHFYALSDFHLNGIHAYVNSAASPVVLDFIRRNCPKPLIHPLYCIYVRTFLGVGFIGSTTTESLLGLSGVHQPFTLLNYMRHGWLGQTLQTLTFGGRDLGLFGTLIKLSIILRGLATVTQGVYEFTGFVSDQFSRNMETDITETRSTVIKKAESNPKSLPALRVIQDWLSSWIEKYSRLEKKAGATLRNYMFQARLAFIISLM